MFAMTSSPAGYATAGGGQAESAGLHDAANAYAAAHEEVAAVQARMEAEARARAAAEPFGVAMQAAYNGEVVDAHGRLVTHRPRGWMVRRFSFGDSLAARPVTAPPPPLSPTRAAARIRANDGGVGGGGGERVSTAERRREKKRRGIAARQAKRAQKLATAVARESSRKLVHK